RRHGTSGSAVRSACPLLAVLRPSQSSAVSQAVLFPDPAVNAVTPPVRHVRVAVVVRHHRRGGRASLARGNLHAGASEVEVEVETIAFPATGTAGTAGELTRPGRPRRSPGGGTRAADEWVGPGAATGTAAAGG